MPPTSDSHQILQQDDPRLRVVAKEIPIKDIDTPKIKKIIQSMKKALESQNDGIGLAGPQIGVSLRIFIVSSKVFEHDEDSIKNNSLEKNLKGNVAGNIATKTLTNKKNPDKKTIVKDLICINPVIIKESKEKRWMEGEGCLSVRWYYGKVKRSSKVTIRAYDEHGKVFTRGASGLLSHIFQHEIDHLDGILFIDKAKDIQEMTEAEIRAQSRG